MARTWTIGGSQENDLVVNDQVVSGRHCRLTTVDGGYLLEDLGSTNGTFVNGERIRSERFVTRRDVVTLGQNHPLPWPEDEPPAPPRRVLRIGRDRDNDLVVNLATVSGFHAQVTWNGVPGEALLEDLGSANGTAVGTLDRKVSKALIRTGETVFLGSHPIAAEEILARLERGPLPILAIGELPLVLGRNPGCGHLIDFPAVSGRHARVSRTPTGFLIEDLGSSNGTFVNGVRIAAPTSVNAGDVVSLGSYAIRLIKEPREAVFANDSPRASTGLTADAPVTLTPGLSDLLAGPEPPSIPTVPERLPIASRKIFSSDVFQQELFRLGEPGWRLLVLLVQALGFGLLIVNATSNDKISARMFALGLSAVWFGISNALIGCSQLETRLAGFDRYAAKLLGLGLLCVVQCLLAWSIVALGKNLVTSESTGIVLMALTSLVGLTIGLLIAELLPRRAQVWTVVALALIPMIILGGETPVYAKLPSAAKSTAALVPTRWAFEGLLLLATEGSQKPEMVADDALERDLAEKFFPADSDRMGVTADLASLGAMVLGLAMAGAFISMGPRQSA